VVLKAWVAAMGVKGRVSVVDRSIGMPDLPRMSSSLRSNLDGLRSLAEKISMLRSMITKLNWSKWFLSWR
jgi:hypothetical protein